MKENITNILFIINHIIEGIQLRIVILKGANHPPKNRIVIKKDINIMWQYSPRKNKAKVILEYSTL